MGDGWMDQAACKGQYGEFLLTDRTVKIRRERAKRLVAICESCPVLHECRQWVLSTPFPPREHVVGGLTPKEIAKERRTLRTPDRIIHHGELAAVQWHYRHRQPLCRLCADMYTRYSEGLLYGAT